MGESQALRQSFMSSYSFPESKGYLPGKLGEFWEYCKKLFVFDNVVLMQDRVVIPPLRKQVLLALHSAHQGVNGMGLNVQSTVFWPGITEDVQAICDQCRPCIRNAPSRAKLPPIEPIFPQRLLKQS